MANLASSSRWMMTDTLDRVEPTTLDRVESTDLDPQTVQTTRVAKQPKRLGLRESNAVAIAARKLDDVTPDWFRKVNPLTIVLVSEDICVLGQIYGSYAIGLKHVRTYYINGICPYIGDSIIQHHFLKKAWRREIRARR